MGETQVIVVVGHGRTVSTGNRPIHTTTAGRGRRGRTPWLLTLPGGASILSARAAEEGRMAWEATMPAARESLLDAAFTALADRPWAVVRMVDVAVAAGVSRQTLYNEFG
ncbi:TetR family transcriptional regulator, partial [Streptomyces sp. 2MCAF27]